MNSFGFAQFERDTIAERTREGLRSARARGRAGGRPRTNPDDIRRAVRLYNTQEYSVKEIEELTGVKKSQLKGLIHTQHARFMQDNKGTENKDKDCLEVIRELYKSNRFCLAKSIDHFNRNKHDGLVYSGYNCLCLQGKCINRIADRCFHRTSHKKIIQTLKDKGALKLVAEKNTVQIKGKRFYAIKLSALK